MQHWNALKRYPATAGVVQTFDPPVEDSTTAPGDDNDTLNAAMLLGALPVAIYTTDRAGRITSFNETATALWGGSPTLGSDRWCPSARLLDHAGEPMDDDRSPVTQCLATGVPLRAVEALIEQPDGTRIPVAFFPNPLRDPDGTLVGAIVMLVDLTRWKAKAEIASAAEERYRLVATAAGDVVWDVDLIDGSVRWNAALEQHFGHSATDHEGSLAWWLDQVHPNDVDRVRATMLATATDGANRISSEYRFRRADGSYAEVLDRGYLIHDSNGTPVRAIGALIDLSERKRADEALRLSEERLRLAAIAARLGIADYDVATHQEHWSAELFDILGLPRDAPACASTFFDLLHPDEQPTTIDHRCSVRRGVLDPGYSAVRRIIRPADGAERWIETEGHAIRDTGGLITRIIVTAKDVTETKSVHDQITWAATHDQMTELPNRAAFHATLETALKRGTKVGAEVGLLLVDLDNFKFINDTLGHQAGDQALISFAERITGTVSQNAMVARLGGDEFAVILPGADGEDCAAASRDILAALQPPLIINGRRIDLRASIGIAVFPFHGEDRHQLVQSADIALYAAKRSGRATVRTFEAEMRSDLQRRVSMLRQARAALANDWIEPFYQPKISLHDGRITGFEALLRWRHPSTGLQLPRTISAAFDDVDTAEAIGRHMAEAALRDLRGWLDQGLTPGTLALNVSAAEFRQPGCAARLIDAANRHGVPPQMIQVEITETALLTDRIKIVRDELETLRAAGFAIALDDFGTGFSSLSHLRNFPVDIIKIDRSFVAGIGQQSDDAAIIEAVLSLARALGKETVAEGVETQAQADFLRSRGCITAQGYLYAHPLPTAEVPIRLARGARIGLV